MLSELSRPVLLFLLHGASLHRKLIFLAIIIRLVMFILLHGESLPEKNYSFSVLSRLVLFLFILLILSRGEFLTGSVSA